MAEFERTHYRDCARERFRDGCQYVPLPPQRPGAPPTARRNAETVRDLVLRAVNLLQLPEPEAEIRPMARFPDGAVGGLTGAPLWLGIPKDNWPTLHQRTEAGAAWAEVTARPVSQTWRFGDDTRPLICHGPGTPLTGHNIDKALDGSPTCGHTYTVSSKDQPQRRYTITVTVTWQVTWTGSGDTGGILAPLRLDQTFTYTVRQARAQLVDPGT